MKREQESGERTARDERVGRTPAPETDVLSRSLPDPKRLSPVCRAALARRRSRWLAFARALKGGRGRTAGANPLGFVESLFGGKFAAAEGGAFSWDRVYRKAGGGRFVSETTRLNISLSPRFDLRTVLVKPGGDEPVKTKEVATKEVTTKEIVAGGVAAQEAVTKELATKEAETKEVVRTITLRVLPPAGARDEAAPPAVWRGANFDYGSRQTISQSFYQTISRGFYQTVSHGLFPALVMLTRPGFSGTTTLQHATTHAVGVREATALRVWDAARAGAARLPRAFSYVNARGERVREAHGVVYIRQPAPGGGALAAGTETRGQTQAWARAAHQPGLAQELTARRGFAWELVSLRDILGAAGSAYTTTRDPSGFPGDARQLTRPGLRQSRPYAPRQEFLRVYHNTPVAVGEVAGGASVLTTQNLAGNILSLAPSQGRAERHQTPSLDTTVNQSPSRAYAVRTQRRQAPGGVVEIRERYSTSRPAEGHSPSWVVPGHAAERGLLRVASRETGRASVRPLTEPFRGQLQTVSHKTAAATVALRAALESVRSSLRMASHSTAVNVLAGAWAVAGGGFDGGAGHARASYQLGERAPARTLQSFRTYRGTQGVQEASPAAHTHTTVNTHAAAYTLSPVHTLPAVHTFRAVYAPGARVRPPRADSPGQTVEAHVLNSAVFVLPGAAQGLAHGFARQLIQRRGFARELARHLNILGAAAPGYTTSGGYSERGGLYEFEFTGRAVRPPAARQIQADGPQTAAGAETHRGWASGTFGARTFLFSSRMREPSAGASATRPMTMTTTAAPFVLARSAFSWMRAAGAAGGAGATAGVGVAVGAAPEAGGAHATRHEAVARELIRQRRAEDLRLPPLGYVFTQTARPAAEERRVITKTNERDIVEVVKREVRALAASGAMPPASSRADFAGLADEVYSTLVRRLMVEKERLGLSS